MAIYTEETFPNYYEDTEYISNSMIGAYLRDPKWYSDLYITKKKQRAPKQQFKLGAAVDCLLTEGLDEFYKKYTFEKIDRRTKVGKERAQEIEEQGIIVLTQAQMDMTLGIYDRLAMQPFIQDLLNGTDRWRPAQAQIILTNEEKKMKGKLDFLRFNVDQTEAEIVDVKTTRSIHPKKYEYSARDYGYYRQLAFYRDLVFHNYPNLKKVTCSHFAVEKDNEGIYHCQRYKFTDHALDIEKEKIYDILEEMRHSKFEEQLVTEDDYILLGEQPEGQLIEF